MYFRDQRISMLVSVTMDIFLSNKNKYLSCILVLCLLVAIDLHGQSIREFEQIEISDDNTRNENRRIIALYSNGFYVDYYSTGYIGSGQFVDNHGVYIESSSDTIYLYRLKTETTDRNTGFRTTRYVDYFDQTQAVIMLNTLILQNKTVEGASNTISFLEWVPRSLNKLQLKKEYVLTDKENQSRVFEESERIRFTKQGLGSMVDFDSSYTIASNKFRDALQARIDTAINNTLIKDREYNELTHNYFRGVIDRDNSTILVDCTHNEVVGFTYEELILLALNDFREIDQLPKFMMIEIIDRGRFIVVR